VAEVLGRQIIEELNLPPEKRTITPEQGIGEAGGTKYILVLTPPPLLVSFCIASDCISRAVELSRPWPEDNLALTTNRPYPPPLPLFDGRQAGCFFKLQKDMRGLYGGEKYAMKATSAELRNMKVNF
jgi:hypothetical protein